MQIESHRVCAYFNAWLLQYYNLKFVSKAEWKGPLIYSRIFFFWEGKTSPSKNALETFISKAAQKQCADCEGSKLLLLLLLDQKAWFSIYICQLSFSYSYHPSMFASHRKANLPMQLCSNYHVMTSLQIILLELLTPTTLELQCALDDCEEGWK